jgi:putative intracellular protease/amidase
MLAKTIDAVETSHQRAGSMMFSHPEIDVSNSQSMVVDRSLEEQLKLQESVGDGDTNADVIYVLVVPGGIGTRNDVGAGIDFVKRIYPSLKALPCVCTGAPTRGQ